MSSGSHSVLNNLIKFKTSLICTCINSISFEVCFFLRISFSLFSSGVLPLTFPTALSKYSISEIFIILIGISLGQCSQTHHIFLSCWECGPHMKSKVKCFKLSFQTVGELCIQTTSFVSEVVILYCTVELMLFSI